MDDLMNLTITNDIEYEYAIKILERFATHGYSCKTSEELLEAINSYELLEPMVKGLEQEIGPGKIRQALMRVLKDQNPSADKKEINEMADMIEQRRVIR